MGTPGVACARSRSDPRWECVRMGEKRAHDDRCPRVLEAAEGAESGGERTDARHGGRPS